MILVEKIYSFNLTTFTPFPQPFRFMAQIGETCTLSIVSTPQHGYYLDGGDLGEILLPKRYAPRGMKPGDELEVFLYLDSEDRPIATTEKPYARVGEFTSLQVVDMAPFGAFLDWGLPKDILVPKSEMPRPMEKGKFYVVKILMDEASNRIIASARLDRHMSTDTGMFEQGQEVEITIAQFTDMGCKVIVENHCWGLLYDNEIFQELRRGEVTVAYVKKVREDGKLDLILQKPGYEAIDPISENIMDALEQMDGFLPYNDKSAPEDIYEAFGISKKAFKKAIGALYKSRQIRIEENGIHKT